MMQIQIDGDKALREIEKKLGNLQKKSAPKILSKAVNEAAKEARKLLAEKAQETYAVKASGFNAKSGAKSFDSALGLKKATTAKPIATLSTRGAPIELFKFKTSPATYKTGDAKAKRTRARVKAHGGMKDILVDGRWAFVTQFKSGHKTLVQRTSKKRLPIKTLYSPSIPQMIGNEKEVYGVVEPQIQELLRQHIEKQLQKELAKGS